MKEATADERGEWRVELDPLTAGGPDTMTITGANELSLEDVLVGEVWLGAGQSNMALPLKSVSSLEAVVGDAPYPRLRLIGGGVRNRRDTGWKEATADELPRFSAELFHFGLALQEELDVPVGLMVGAVGGTPACAWLSGDSYKVDKACQDAIARFTATFSEDEARAKHEQATAKYAEAKAAWDGLSAEEQKGKIPPRKPGNLLMPGDARVAVGIFFNRDIKPFAPFALRGVLWDQGEAGSGILGVDQYAIMGVLIRGWREAWGQGEFPFLYVQKPSGGGSAWDPADPVTLDADEFTALPATLPEGGTHQDGRLIISTLEDHLKIMRYPNTFLVTASDLQSGLHPGNKHGYGMRAARVAMGAVYGAPIEIYGPIYRSHTIEDGVVRVRFSHAEKGLAFKHGGRLQGFALAGADHRFVWADATIEPAAQAGQPSDTVAVSSAEVPEPLYVRYAWAPKHAWANLFNGDGLPALSFRTDELAP